MAEKEPYHRALADWEVAMQLRANAVKEARGDLLKPSFFNADSFPPYNTRYRTASDIINPTTGNQIFYGHGEMANVIYTPGIHPNSNTFGTAIAESHPFYSQSLPLPAAQDPNYWFARYMKSLDSMNAYEEGYKNAAQHGFKGQDLENMALGYGNEEVNSTEHSIRIKKTGDSIERQNKINYLRQQNPMGNTPHLGGGTVGEHALKIEELSRDLQHYQNPASKVSSEVIASTRARLGKYLTAWNSFMASVPEVGSGLGPKPQWGARGGFLLSATPGAIGAIQDANLGKYLTSGKGGIVNSGLGPSYVPENEITRTDSTPYTSESINKMAYYHPDNADLHPEVTDSMRKQYNPDWFKDSEKAAQDFKKNIAASDNWKKILSK